MPSLTSCGSMFILQRVEQQLKLLLAQDLRQSGSSEIHRCTWNISHAVPPKRHELPRGKILKDFVAQFCMSSGEIPLR